MLPVLLLAACGGSPSDSAGADSSPGDSPPVDTGGADTGVACDVPDGCGIEGDHDAARDATLVGSTPEGYAGRSLAAAGDVDGDGRGDLLVAAPGAYEGEGSVYLLRGPLRGELGLEAVAAATASRTNPFAASVAGAGDADGDGRSDVLVGGLDPWTAYLVADPLTEGLVPSAAIATYVGVDAEIGSGLAGPGDLDGDGTPELLFGNGSPAGPLPVAAYVVSAERRGDVALDADAVTIRASTSSTYPGNRAVWVGDVDGDGADDLALGDFADHRAGNGAGAVAVFRGGISGVVTLDDADLTVTGEAGEYLAMGLSAGGDLTGDGRPDLLAGSWYMGGHGGAVVFAADGAGVVAAADVTLASFSLRAGLIGDPVDVVGDTNGDGVADVLLVDAQGEAEGGSRRHAGWLFSGPLAGSLTPSDATADLTVPVEDGGWRVDAARGVGDLNGDGFADVAIGNMHDGRDVSYGGAVYLLYGG